MRETTPVARRVLGESNEATLRARLIYAMALFDDPGATLDDLREAATTLEDTDRIARRVFGGAHPLTGGIAVYLRDARAAICKTLGACDISRRRLAPSLEDLLETYTPLVKLTDEEKDLLARRTRSVGLLA